MDSDEMIAAIETALQHHRDNDHANLNKDEADALVKEHRNMVDDLALLVEMVAGECVIDEFTGENTGQRKPGIASKVEALDHRSNGGGGFSVRTRDKIIIGLIAAIPSVVAGLVLMIR